MENTPCEYTVMSERVSDPDIGVYNTFGILCRTAGRSIAIDDISTDGKKVAEIAGMFTRMGLAPEHFHDAVEDMLTLWAEGIKM